MKMGVEDLSQRLGCVGHSGGGNGLSFYYDYRQVYNG